MSQKSKKREAEKKAAKQAERRAIEAQYSKGTVNLPGLRPGQLEPQKPNFIGRYSFLSTRQRDKYVSSLRRRRAVDPAPK